MKGKEREKREVNGIGKGEMKDKQWKESESKRENDKEVKGNKGNESRKITKGKVKEKKRIIFR